MDADPWGTQTPSMIAGEVPPLPPRLAELADLAASGESLVLEPGERWEDASAEDLPEVQALVPDGWRPLDEDPLTELLPAVWPPRHRCWVPDRMPKLMSWVCPPEPPMMGALPEGHTAAREEELAAEAAGCGLPAPPPGRLWLLRSPWPTLGLGVVLSMMRRRYDEGRPDWSMGGYLESAADLLTWSEEQVWSWWQGTEADAASAWRRVGRVGEEVSALVGAGLGPAHTARLTAPVSAGGAGLSERQSAIWSVIVAGPDVESRVEAVIGWRALGMSADPPENEPFMLYETTPAEAGPWLADGFSLEELSVWLGVRRQSARAWRDAGFLPAPARELLAADATLTPAEAVAFDEVEIAADTRLGWVEAGFSAAQAQAWTAIDVFPSEARVWRAQGLSVEDAGRHRGASGEILPNDVQLGWFGFGTGRGDWMYGVEDPPGTRGRLATHHGGW